MKPNLIPTKEVRARHFTENASTSQIIAALAKCGVAPAETVSSPGRYGIKYLFNESEVAKCMKDDSQVEMDFASVPKIKKAKVRSAKEIAERAAQRAVTSVRTRKPKKTATALTPKEELDRVSTFITIDQIVAEAGLTSTPRPTTLLKKYDIKPAGVIMGEGGKKIHLYRKKAMKQFLEATLKK